MAFKLVYPLPEGEVWGCLPCEMNSGHDTNATVLLVEGEPGQRGMVKTGLCSNCAEVMDWDAIREAQRKYRALVDQNEQNGL